MLYRAGALTDIHIPTEREEGAKELLRCREDIREDLLRARHRLSKFLLRTGQRFTATKKAWSKRHDAWLRTQTWPLPALDQTHHAYLRAVDEVLARLRAVEEDLRGLLDLEPLQPRVQRLRSFRGIDYLDSTEHCRRTRRPAALCHGNEHDGDTSASCHRSITEAPNARRVASPKQATTI